MTRSRAGGGTGGALAILTRREVISVLAVVLLMMIGLGVAFPIVPLYARSFGVSLGVVGVFIAAFGATRLVFDLVGGVIVDRFGPRAVAVSGLSIMAVASLLTGLAGGFGAATAAWATAGAGSAIVFAALYSYMLRVVPNSEMARAFGLFYGTFNVGIIAGGPLGGLLADRFGLRGPFIAYAGLLALAAVVYARLVRDAAEPWSESIQPTSRAGALASLLANRGFLAACAANLAYLWMVAAIFETLVPLLAREGLGMSVAGIGLVFAIATAAELAVLYPAGTWADRVGRRTVLIPSLACLAVMTAVVGWASGPAELAVSLGFLGIASGIAGVPPAAMLSDVSPDERAGTAVGVFRFCGDLGFVFGPVVAGTAAARLGFAAAFAVSAVPTALAVVVALWAPETLGARHPVGAVAGDDSASTGSG